MLREKAEIERVEEEIELEDKSQYIESEESDVAEVAEIIAIKQPPKDLYLARQPIFTRSMNVYAYELLYANRGAVSVGATDDNASSAQVMINAFLDLDLASVSDELPSFIGVTQDFLVGRLPLPFASAAVVLEIPASMVVNEDTLAGLRHFAKAGFGLALEVSSFDIEPSLLDLVDFIKLDISHYKREQLKQGMSRLAGRNLQSIATRVDTREQLQDCTAAGFTLFQGRFICKPVVLAGHVLKPSRIALLKILKLLEDPDCSISVLEELISRDVTLSYKILRIINSAYYGFRRKIESVKQAVVSLGLKTIRDWFIVISLTDIDDKPQELMLLTLQRARMMQLLANAMGLNKDTGFTIGLFSAIDAIMDQPMEQILAALPLSEEITEALLHHEGMLGQMLDIVLHYEQGDWQYVNKSGFEMSELGTFYFEAMHWARGLCDQTKNNA